MLSQAQKQVSRKVLGADAASEVAQTAESTKKLHTSAAASAIGTLVRSLHARRCVTVPEASGWVLGGAPVAGKSAMQFANHLQPCLTNRIGGPPLSAAASKTPR